jgi:hypothetical protein
MPRPVFVDPTEPPASGPVASATQSLYEQDLLPTAVRTPGGAEDDPRLESGSPRRSPPVVWLAGLAVAVAVVIAALLLVAGVL